MTIDPQLVAMLCSVGGLGVALWRAQTESRNVLVSEFRRVADKVDEHLVADAKVHADHERRLTTLEGKKSAA